MFGDNKSVVNLSTQLYAKLTKRHNMLSFHRVCEAITFRFVAFVYMPGKTNLADVLSKHWSFDDARDTLLSILHCYRDMSDVMKKPQCH